MQRRNWPSIRPVGFGIVLMLLLTAFSYIEVDLGKSQKDWSYASGYNPHGGYIDRLTWIVYPFEAQQEALAALQQGHVYAYDQTMTDSSIPELINTKGVEVSWQLGTYYRQFTLNCHNFPTNITGYRRALAYALDKYAVCDASTGGYAVPMDGAIPLNNSYWTYENQIIDHFYTKDIVRANACLEAAQFRDLDSDGWREYDANNDSLWNLGDIDDDELSIELWVSYHYQPAIQAAAVLVQGMHECGLPAVVAEVDFESTLPWYELRVGCFTWQTQPPGEPELLYDYFYSQSSTNKFFYQFNSSEYDYNVIRMMTAPTKFEARTWAWNCSKILLEQMPMITCYNDVVIHAYRDDIWEGYVPMLGVNRMGVNPFTFIQLRLTELAGGPYGCYPSEYVCVLTEGIDTTNVIMTDSAYTNEVFMNIYSRLWQVDPYTWEKVPDLAYNWTIEQTVASGDVLDGQKFTFHLYENITWHDTMPFTAEDVKYSLETIWPYGPYDAELVENIYRIDTIDNYTVVIYTSQPGYFEFARATSCYILPKHIWEPHSNFTEWQPQRPDELVGTGPYQWAVRVPGQYITLERNENWHFRIEMPGRPYCFVDGPPTYILLVLIAVVIIEVVILFVLLHRKTRYSGKNQSESVSTKIP